MIDTSNSKSIVKVTGDAKKVKTRKEVLAEQKYE